MTWLTFTSPALPGCGCRGSPTTIPWPACPLMWMLPGTFFTTSRPLRLQPSPPPGPPKMGSLCTEPPTSSTWLPTTSCRSSAAVEQGRAGREMLRLMVSRSYESAAESSDVTEDVYRWGRKGWSTNME